MINKKTLAALNHLVRNDTGYVNEHGVHFFTIGDGEINVHLMLEVNGDANFAYLSLDVLSPEAFMQDYGIHHLEDLSDITESRMWEEYHNGRAFLAGVAGEIPQTDIKFRTSDGKTVATDTYKETEVLLDVVIDSGVAAEEYALAINALDQTGGYEGDDED